MLLFLIQALIILIVPLLAWWPLRKWVPLAVIQIIGGIALGPTILGAVAPDLKSMLFPVSSFAGLQVMSSLAVVFFCFTAGLHVDLEQVSNKSKSIILVAASGFVLPMIVGLLLANWAYDAWPSLRGDSVTPWSFKIALAMCLAVTALPVLSSILQEMGMLETQIGSVSLSIAAVNDALIWPTVAIALIIARGGSMWSLVITLFSFSLYTAFLLLVIKPLLATWVCPERGAALDLRRKTMLIGGLLASAACTEFMGLHAAIGAFLFGIVIPRAIKQTMATMVGPLTAVALLPFFLAFTGLKVDVSAPELVFLVAAILFGGLIKFFSTAIPARLCGWSWSEGMQLGALMQCKGIMEVLVLAILLDAGTISNICFSTMTMMAIATTCLTMPLIRLLQGSGQPVTRSSRTTPYEA